jgi:predicted O-linked N-acetylglucosamine transferase (SPINDLY family)
MGRFGEAQLECLKILRKRSDDFQALHLLGLSYYLQGDLAAAAALIERALQIDPASAEAHANLGAVLKALKRLPDALQHYDTAVALDPGFANAHANRGNLLFSACCFAEAIASYDQAIALSPGHVAALTNRGCARMELRQLDAAMADFDRALAVDPAHATAWTSRGEALFRQGHYEAALASYDKALAVKPDLLEAWLGAANTLAHAGQTSQALRLCHRALAIAPTSVRGLTLLGKCYAQQGDADAAVMRFDRALGIEPNFEMALSNKIFALDYSSKGNFAEHFLARSAWWNQIGFGIASQCALRHHNERDATRRLVVGYVSGDFKAISPAYSFRPVLQNHDKSQVEVICYSASATEDAVTESFRKVADKWREIAQWSDAELIDAIQRDNVDILVDLSGHTEGNRLRVFACKPAPIQVTAWGFATGSGLPTIDYMFSDPVTIPDTSRQFFAEQIHDLPCFAILEPPPAELHCCEPPVLSNGHVTYGVFNRLSKFSDSAVAVWARILMSDANSRLLIKDTAIDDESIKIQLRARFAAQGIAADRIDMKGRTPRDEHLAAYRQVDICLDPFPQNGGVSTWEALYMGVPVVTKLGDSVASRAAGGILSAVGLPEWGAENEDDYVRIALAATPERLEAIRTDLPARIAARCSPAAYTAEVEKAYRTMWARYCEEVE